MPEHEYYPQRIRIRRQQYFHKVSVRELGWPPGVSKWSCSTVVQQLEAKGRLSAHLTHSGDAWHDGVVKEIKLLPCLTEEEVNLIVVAHHVAPGQTLLDVGRAHKGRLWKGRKEKLKRHESCLEGKQLEFWRHCSIVSLTHTDSVEIKKTFIQIICHYQIRG